jgi:hypothetical protein
VPPGAVDEGWARLERIAEEMASAGYELKTSSKPGSKFSVVCQSLRSVSSSRSQLTIVGLGLELESFGQSASR